MKVDINDLSWYDEDVYQPTKQKTQKNKKKSQD